MQGIPGVDKVRSPELLISTNYGKPLDVWAIGCIMGELIDGRPLFPGDNELDQLYKIQKILGPFPGELQNMLCKSGRHAGVNLTVASNKAETVERRYLGKVSKKGLAFLKATLCLDPSKRISIEEALRHPYFEDLRVSDPYWTKLNQSENRNTVKPKEETEAQEALKEKRQNNFSEEGRSAPMISVKETKSKSTEIKFNGRNKENKEVSNKIRIASFLENKESAFLETQQKSKNINMQKMRKRPRFYNLVSQEKETRSQIDEKSKTPTLSLQKNIPGFDAASIIAQDLTKRAGNTLKQAQTIQEERHTSGLMSGLSQYSHGNTRIRNVKNSLGNSRMSSKRGAGRSSTEAGKSIDKIAAVYIHRKLAKEISSEKHGEQIQTKGLQPVLPLIKTIIFTVFSGQK
jgi:serine/threonine protein kinase